MRSLSLLGLFLLAYLFVLRPVQKHALAPVDAATQQALTASKAQLLATGSGGMGDETLRAAKLKEQAIELIRQKPLGTAHAMQAWMREEPL